jgi:predicted TIM-barrel fold metal-dependent hydrolase
MGERVSIRGRSLRRRHLVRGGIGAAAWFALQGVPIRSAAEGRSGEHARPIVDTHIHLYQVTRPGGVPWPPPGPLFRDVLPPEYKALAAANGIRASGVVEASPLVEDNQWILNLLGHDSFFPFFVGSLEIGSPDFVANLDRFSANRRFVGIRGYLWGPPEGITLDAAQLRDLRALARRGMTLDIISRGTTNPKDRVLALCAAVPDLRVIINHLGGAKGPPPDPDWASWMRRLAAACPNLYMKFSSFFDMYQVGDGSQPWSAPTDLSAYEWHFDVLMRSFGPDRLVWGSNWPVVLLGGTVENQIRLAEEYLARFGKVVRDKVMFRNALLFYRRHVPHGHDPK